MTEQVIVYRANPKICNACPVKSECTGSRSGRYIFRSFFQKQLDKAEACRQTEAYQKAMRKRSMWVEPLFGEAKEFHRLRRFRLRRLWKVNIEGVMAAAGQNLKRLIKRRLAVLFYLLLKRPHASLSFQPDRDFFNSLGGCTTNPRSSFISPSWFSHLIISRNRLVIRFVSLGEFLEIVQQCASTGLFNRLGSCANNK